MLWLRKQKKDADAKLHANDFEAAHALATVNERASFDFIIGLQGVPSFPSVKAYEPYPLRIQGPGFSSKWSKQDRRGISIWLPAAIIDAMEKEIPVAPGSIGARSEFIRDTLANALGVKIPVIATT